VGGGDLPRASGDHASWRRGLAAPLPPTSHLRRS
jgi:hypothetical protein